jgi:acetylornithine deacetylase/succinyl-diaminopimelate desuccinylase-like protein
MRRVRRAAMCVIVPACAAVSGLTAQTAGPRADMHAEERAILAELVNVNSSSGTMGVQRIAQTIARRLRAAGFAAADVQLLGPSPTLTAVVVRYRGRRSGKKPILLMAHMDVVTALPSDWTRPPFVFGETDGWYYGRGVEDNKAGLAAIVSTFVRWKRERWMPERDLVAVLTADEETDGNSIKWLLANHRALFDAEFALNTDAGGVALEKGRALGVAMQASEKVFANFTIESLNAGGHSSVPRADNAIYELATALSRLSAFQFPVRLNEVSTAFFREGAAAQAPELASAMRRVAAGDADSATVATLAAVNPYFSSVLRTTCVATRLAGGHADNALPQSATALVNCRMLPDDPPDSVHAVLQRIVGDRVKVIKSRDIVPSPPSPLRADVVSTMTALSREFFGGAPVVPEMSTGATDGLFTRNAGIPTYGVGSLAFEQSEPSRAHGRDERIGVTAYHTSVAFWERLVKQLAGPAPTVP